MRQHSLPTSGLSTTPAPAAARGEFDARPPNLLLLVFRHRVKFELVLLLGMVLTGLYFATATRQYASTAKMFVKRGRETAVLDPTARTKYGAAMNPESHEKEVFAVAELMNSRRVAEAVVQHFGPQVILERKPNSQSLGSRLKTLDNYNLNPLKVYSIEDKAIEYLHENLSVLAGKKSSVVTLEYSAESPEHARDVLVKLIEVALQEHLRMHRTDGSSEFFVEKAKIAEQKLDRIDADLSEFKTSRGLASLDRQRDHVLDQINGLKLRLQEAKTSKESLLVGLEKRRSTLADTQKMILIEEDSNQPMSVGQSFRERLLALQVQEKDLTSRYSPEHPQVARIREQMAEVEAIISQEKIESGQKLGLNPLYAQLTQEIATAESRLAETESQIAVVSDDLEKANGELQKLNESEVEIGKLELAQQIAAENFKTYQENLEQALINNELETRKISSLNLMEPPTLVKTPYSPHPWITLGLGTVLSTLAALGVCFLFDRRRKLRSGRAPNPAAATSNAESALLATHSSPAAADPAFERNGNPEPAERADRVADQADGENVGEQRLTQANLELNSAVETQSDSGLARNRPR